MFLFSHYTMTERYFVSWMMLYLCFGCHPQGGSRQQRWDHSLFHEGQCHLLQTGSRICPQLPGDHLHETHLLRQLLRICRSPHELSDGVWWNVESALQLFQLYVTMLLVLPFLVHILWCFSPYSSPQLWGVIKQGYRCRGNYCTLSCSTLACLFLSVGIMLRNEERYAQFLVERRLKWSQSKKV